MGDQFANSRATRGWATTLFSSIELYKIEPKIMDSTSKNKYHLEVKTEKSRKVQLFRSTVKTVLLNIWILTKSLEKQNKYADGSYT